MRRRVGVGYEFDGEIRLIEAKRRADEEYVRAWIVLTILAVGAIILLGSASYSIYSGSFRGLQATWSVVGPFVGAIIAYYFRPPGHS